MARHMRHTSRDATISSMSSRLQRTLLLGFVGSIVLCGLIGIYVIAFGSFGWFEARVLSSTVVIGAASVLAMGAAVVWESERRRWLGTGGVFATTLATMLLLATIWERVGSLDSELTWRSVWALGVFAVACPLAGLLGLARLHRAYEGVRIAVFICIALLSALLLWLAIDTSIPSDLMIRAIAVLAILAVVGTIAVPILHRVSHIGRDEAVVTTALQLKIECPRCARSQVVPAGRSACACGLRFRIEIEEEHCSKCGYALYGISSGVCPECGTPVTAQAK